MPASSAARGRAGDDAVGGGHHHDETLDPATRAGTAFISTGTDRKRCRRERRADRGDRPPARAERTRLRQHSRDRPGLLAVIGLDALGGKAQRATARVRRRARRRRSRRAGCAGSPRQGEAVEAFGIVDERRVAPRRDIGDDGGNRGVDIGSRLRCDASSARRRRRTGAALST